MKVFLKNNKVFAYHDDNQQVNYSDCTEVRMYALPPSVPVIQNFEVIGFEYLPVILKNQPDYDQSTQKLTQNWEIQNGEYVQTYQVSNKTANEIIAEKTNEAILADEILNTEEVKKILRMKSDTLTDAEMYQFSSFYPAWKPGVAVTANEKYQYAGKLYKVVQGHTTQIDWTPDVVPALFTKYNPPSVIADWVQPTGAHDAYSKGAKVKFDGNTYESLIDANVWSPTAYPAGWKKL